MKRLLSNLCLAVTLLFVFVYGKASAQEGMVKDDLTITVNGVSFVMKPVKGGTFWMGAQNTDPNGQNYDPDAVFNECPVHSVTLDDYYIGETEVTQALWKAVMGSEPLENDAWYETFGLGGDYPAYRVRGVDCQEFIDRLNQLTGMSFRLPTEAEWEYAARGGKKSKGYRYPGSNDIEEVAWYMRNSGDKYIDSSYDENPFFFEEVILPNHHKTHPVKRKLPNELGLYDMGGNVAEWCVDFYSKNYYAESPSYNPQGPGKGDWMMVRGCGYLANSEEARVSARNIGGPTQVDEGIGLRLALSYGGR